MNDNTTIRLATKEFDVHDEFMAEAKPLLHELCAIADRLGILFVAAACTAIKHTTTEDGQPDVNFTHAFVGSGPLVSKLDVCSIQMLGGYMFLSDTTGEGIEHASQIPFLIQHEKITCGNE